MVGSEQSLLCQVRQNTQTTVEKVKIFNFFKVESAKEVSDGEKFVELFVNGLTARELHPLEQLNDVESLLRRLHLFIMIIVENNRGTHIYRCSFKIKVIVKKVKNESDEI